MKTLHLNLKRKWFDMILSGEKKEEYRDITDYWFRRFKNTQCRCFFKVTLSIAYRHYKETNRIIPFKGLFDSMELRYKTVTFSNGYAKNRDQFEIELKSMPVHIGKEELGAEPGELYFVLKLGEIIKHNSLLNNSKEGIWNQVR